jgi:predicted dehydrogenase
MACALLTRNVPVCVEVYSAMTSQGTVKTVTPSEPGWSYKSGLRHFAQRLRDGEPLLSTAADARSSLRVLEDIYRAYVESKEQQLRGRGVSE